MGFERRRFPDHIREQILPDDEKIFDKCKECPIKEQCGGHKEFLLSDDSRFCDRECWGCRAVCCKLDDIYERLEEFNGIEFDDIKFDYWEKDWPKFIWTIDESIEKLDSDWYAIPFDSLYNVGYESFNSEEKQKERFDIPESGNLTLSFCMKDEILDRFDSAEEVNELSITLKQYDFDFLLPINFSVYRNYPRVDQLFNMKKRLYSMQQFQMEGFKSLPDLAFSTQRDIKRWAEWAEKQRISCAFFNFQTKKSENKEKYLKSLDNLKTFDDELSLDCHYIIGGVGERWIRPILNEFKNITFLNVSAWSNASFRQSIFKEKLKGKGYSKLEIFEINKNIMKSIYDDEEPQLPDKTKKDFGV